MANISLNSSNLTPESELTLCVFGFNMVTYLGTISVVGGAQYNITVNQPQHGTINAPSQAYAQSTVTLTATPETGYCLSSWNVRDASNNSITVTNNQFTMPSSNVTISAEFELAPINVTANEGATGEYWATFFSNIGNYQASAGTQVFAVNLAGTAITMTEITDGIVNSGQGVVLKNTSASITMTPTASNSSDDYSGNTLVGTMTNITNPGNAYVLNKKNGVVGLFKLSDTGTIGANKAYLVYSGSGDAPTFFGFGETTGVNEVRSMMAEGRGDIYNLNGQKVLNPTRGLYIVNGKKVVIK
jgi:hypothetical protein